MIRILRAGIGSSIQDSGRYGQRHLGIAWAGALDQRALQLLNLLLGNDQHAAGLEILAGPFALQFLTDSGFALRCATGQATLECGDGRTVSIVPGRSYCASANDKLTLCAIPCAAPVTLAIAGGIASNMVLGSRATDSQCGIGSDGGRFLQGGCELSLGAENSFTEGITVSLPNSDGVLRILPCDEFLSLDRHSQTRLSTTRWRVGADSNRMGLRLESDCTLKLENTIDRRHSQAVFPGCIQLPSSGKPLILRADAQTTGGYPLIANVIAADNWKLAQATVGSELHLQCVDESIAIAALKAYNGRLEQFRLMSHP